MTVLLHQCFLCLDFFPIQAVISTDVLVIRKALSYCIKPISNDEFIAVLVTFEIRSGFFNEL